jgi:cell division septation protein DedD
MLRVLVLLLVLSNGLFYAWAQGWLSPVMPPRPDQREPGRLLQQVHPELVTVLSVQAADEAVAGAAGRSGRVDAAESASTATPASAADGAGEARTETVAAVASAPAESPVAAAEVLLCLEAGPFTQVTVQAAETALEQNSVPEGSVVREPMWQSFTWGVVIGPLADRDALRSKLDELKKIGVASDELTVPPALLPGLRLGNYSDRYGAEAALNNLAKKGVRGAKVAPLPTGTAQQWLRVRQADAEMQTRLKSLPNDHLGAGFKPCVPPKPPARA